MYNQYFVTDTQAYSAKDSQWVGLDDADYQAWLSGEGNYPTQYTDEKAMHTWLGQNGFPHNPQRVTARSARVAVNQAGLRQQVEDAVAQADQDTRDFWEYSIYIDRDDGRLNAIASHIGLTEQQLDDLFAAADAVERQ